MARALGPPGCTPHGLLSQLRFQVGGSTGERETVLSLGVLGASCPSHPRGLLFGSGCHSGLNVHGGTQGTPGVTLALQTGEWSGGMARWGCRPKFRDGYPEVTSEKRPGSVWIMSLCVCECGVCECVHV